MKAVEQVIEGSLSNSRALRERGLRTAYPYFESLGVLRRSKKKTS